MRNKVKYFVMFVLLLAACSQPDSSPTPAVENAQTATPELTSTLVATTTPKPTFTASPTASETPHPTPYTVSGTCGNSPLMPRLAQEIVSGEYTLTVDSQGGAMLNNTVRSMKLTVNELWVGYGGTDRPINLSVLNATNWETCETVQGHVNMIGVSPDPTNDVWVITDGKGFYRLHNGGWFHYHSGFEPMFYGNSPVDNRGYDVDFDFQGNTWISTYWEVYCFSTSEEEWYACDVSDHGDERVHALVLLEGGGAAYATIDNGGAYRDTAGQIHYFSKHDDPQNISTDAMRVVEMHEGGLYFGGDPGFLGRYDLETEQWQVDSLPAPLNVGAVLDVEWQSDGTLWLATTTGTAYKKDGKWTVFSTLPALTLELCEDCFLGTHLVIIGTDGAGIIVAEMPK